MQSPSSSRFSLERACTTVLLVAFAAAAIAVSAAKDLWLDELLSWYQVTDKDFAGFMAAAKTGINLMPLGHFVLLWGLNGMGWLTPWAARLLSIAAMTLGLAIFERTTRRTYGPTVALVVVAVLVGASTLLLNLAAEVRPYAFSFLFAAIAFAAATELGRERRAKWSALAGNFAASFALPAVSYPAGLYSAALLATYVVASRLGGRKPQLLPIASFLAGWTLFLLLCGPLLIQQFTNPFNFLGQPTRLHGSDLVEVYAGFFHSSVWPVVATLVLAAWLCLVQRKWSWLSDRRGAISDALPAVAFNLVPLLLFSLGALKIITVWQARYVLPTAAGLVILAGPLLRAKLAASPRQLRSFSLVVFALALLSLAINTRDLRRANTATVYQKVTQVLPPDLNQAPVIVTDPYTYFHLLFYGPKDIDLRYPSAHAAFNQDLIVFSSRIHPLTTEQALSLPSFIVVAGGHTPWKYAVHDGAAKHGLHLTKVMHLNYGNAAEIWYFSR